MKNNPIPLNNVADLFQRTHLPNRFLIASESNSSTDMAKLVEDMFKLLQAVADKTVPNDRNYPLNDLKNYLSSLVLQQRSFIGLTSEGSWAVVHDASGMPSDARVDFVFTPTYIAVAILSFCWLEYPSICEAIPNYRSSLENGMKFSTLRNLQGAEFDDSSSTESALKILRLGRVQELLKKKKDLCPEMAVLLKELK